MKDNPDDPLDVDNRLYRQLSRLLKRLEEMEETISYREQVAILAMIGRVQAVRASLKVRDESDAGSAVRKYSSAFKTSVVKGGDRPRPSALEFSDDDDEHDTQ